MGVLEFFLGALLSVVCMWVGWNAAIYTTEHSVNTYVKRLTPKDLDELNNIQPTDYIPEENLWASGMTESEYANMMGWPKKGENDGRENETPNY